MTEPTTSAEPMPAVQETAQERSDRLTRERNESLKRCITDNRALICAALRAASYENVTVRFNGEDDDGSITSIEIRHRNDDVGFDIEDEDDGSIRARKFMESCSILYHQAADSNDPEKYVPFSLEVACRELTLDILEMDARGWQDGDGAFGTLFILAEADQAMLDMDHRIIELENQTATY
jgi:hypothetical protein